MASLSNPCDIESKDFFPQLIVSVSIEGGFCQKQIVNPGDLYNYTEFTFYKSIPISVLPKLGSKAEISTSPSLPPGLYVDPNTGALSGTPTSPGDRQNYTVLRKGVALGQISIQVRGLAATKVYGQLGDLNCADPYVNGSCGSGGPVTADNLSGPNAVITDKSDGVYISSGNRVLYYPAGQTTATRVYGQHGQFTCDAANANSNLSCSTSIISANTLSVPRGIFLDPLENLYITDSTPNNRLLVFPNGNTTPSRALGVPDYSTAGPGPGSASASNFVSPIDLKLDSSGGIFLSDFGNNRILYFPKDANVATEVYGQPDFTNASFSVSESRFSTNQGFEIDSVGGMYIADRGNHRVVYFPKGSTSATKVYGQSSFSVNTGGLSNNGLTQPTDVALDQSENLFVADFFNHRILVYPRTSLTSGMTAIAVIGQSGSFTCNASNNDGTGCTSAGTVPNTQSFRNPVAIHFDKQGRLYVVDNGNHRVVVY
ncbi:NHL repeat-containing protein [Leptospira vanthielii]|uniref:NHL repeat protein n=1 Tax=Leptospira vanthielii TaxID=293085 RepID=A0ABY2NKD3_9LEPT|nr:NHL repeat-containing protein [Leptospira vanthielii]TGM46223.1 hypothetical protein EHQ95_16395 [Leptospira vanthielii]